MREITTKRFSTKASKGDARETERVKAARASRLLERGIAHSAGGRFRLAEDCLLRALKSAPARPDSITASRPAIWNELGMVCKYLGKLSSSERYYRLALRHTGRLPQCVERDFLLSSLYHNLGGLEHSRKRFPLAEKYARKGIELRTRCAPEDRLALASDRSALAAILDGREKYGESEKLYRMVLRTYRRELGASHREIAVVLNNLGALYQATGRPQKAEASYIAALKMKRRELGRGHSDVGVTLNNLGTLYKSLNRRTKAQSCFTSALRILESTLGRLHPTTRAVRRSGNAYLEAGHSTSGG